MYHLLHEKILLTILMSISFIMKVVKNLPEVVLSKYSLKYLKMTPDIAFSKLISYVYKCYYEEKIGNYPI